MKDFLKNPRNRQFLFFVLGAICLYFYSKRKAKAEELKTFDGGYAGMLRGDYSIPKTPTTPTVPVTPDPVPTPVPERTAVDQIGAYTTRVGTFTFTHSKSPELVLQYNADGTITDVTPGLTFDGTTNMIGGRRRYYMTGLKVFENANGTYNRVQNVLFADGPFTLHAFDIYEADITGHAMFRTNMEGWNQHVNLNTTRFSSVSFSKKADTKTGYGIVPDYLKVTRQLIFPSAAKLKDWTSFKKWFGSGLSNKGDSPDLMKTVGVAPHLDYDDNANQPGTFNTTTATTTPTRQEYYDMGYGMSIKMGGTNRSLITSQFCENLGQQEGANVSEFYRGYRDGIVAATGISDVGNIGAFGDYGKDNYDRWLNAELLYGNRQNFEESLTTKIHNGYNNGWAGIAGYYADGHVDVRNANCKIYMNMASNNFAYALLYLQERVALGAKLWQDTDRDRGLSTFTWPFFENLSPDPVEFANTGEIIPFAGGEIISRNNFKIGAPWDEQFVLGYYSALVLKGFEHWDAPRSFLGTNPAKIQHWEGGIKWKAAGGSEQDYVSGQNGAPINDSTGMFNRLGASAIDGAVAGMEAVWDVRDRIQTISYASGTGSRGTWTATPGTAGHNINGRGPKNLNQFEIRNIVENKQPIRLDCSGPGGRLVSYYNGFLSPHEFDDNVTVNGVALGKVYGKQIVHRIVE